MEYPDFKVCVRCFTYNQSKYITETLDGFCLQKTDFPFVCCIVDDASTDNEQSIILEYLNNNFELNNQYEPSEYETDYAKIVYCQHKRNLNCYFAVLLLKENLYSKGGHWKKWQYISRWREKCKYEAICEGDDYWIDPLKLQKQIHFLENNDSFSIIGSSYSILNQKTGRMSVYVPKRKRLNFKQTLISGGIGAATCSVLYRRESTVGYQEFIKNNNWPLGDLSLWLYILRDSQAFVMDDITSMYRCLSESASHTKSYNKAVAFNQGIFDIQLFFAEKYDQTVIPLLRKKLNKRMFYTAIQYGKTKDAIKYAKGTKLDFKDYLRIMKSIFVNNQENNKA